MKPTYDNVFITEVQKEKTTSSGIILTQDLEGGNKPAVIVAVGPECDSQPGLKCFVKWADVVPVTHDGVAGGIISEKEILAYIQ